MGETIEAFVNEVRTMLVAPEDDRERAAADLRVALLGQVAERLARTPGLSPEQAEADAVRALGPAYGLVLVRQRDGTAQLQNRAGAVVARIARRSRRGARRMMLVATLVMLVTAALLVALALGLAGSLRG